MQGDNRKSVHICDRCVSKEEWFKSYILKYYCNVDVGPWLRLEHIQVVLRPLHAGAAIKGFKVRIKAEAFKAANGFKSVITTELQK